jgi:hypothetical protein
MDQDWLPYDLKHRRREVRLQRDRHRVKGWLPTMIFGSMGVVSIGIGCMEMGAGQMTELVCRRSGNQMNQTNQLIHCTRTVTTGLIRETPIEVKDVEEAFVQHVGRKFRNAYRVVLVTKSGNVPVTEDFKSDEREKEIHVRDINHFIATSSEASLSLQEDDRAQSNLFGLMFIATGSLWVLMAIVLQIAVNRKTVLVKKI